MTGAIHVEAVIGDEEDFGGAAVGVEGDVGDAGEALRGMDEGGAGTIA